MKLDPEPDAFDPANGFDPEYSEVFLKKFFEAQAARNNAVVKRALERLRAIESGKGFYADDEPFSVTGGADYAITPGGIEGVQWDDVYCCLPGDVRYFWLLFISPLSLSC